MAKKNKKAIAKEFGTFLRLYGRRAQKGREPNDRPYDPEIEHELRRRGITQKNGKPNHPQTQGKVERFQQTLKRWLAAQAPQPAAAVPPGAPGPHTPPDAVHCTIDGFEVRAAEVPDGAEAEVSRVPS